MADFSQAGWDGGNNSPFRRVSSSAPSLPASPPPFLLTPYMAFFLKGILMFVEALLWMPGTTDNESCRFHLLFIISRLLERPKDELFWMFVLFTLEFAKGAPCTYGKMESPSCPLSSSPPCPSQPANAPAPFILSANRHSLQLAISKKNPAIKAMFHQNALQSCYVSVFDSTDLTELVLPADMFVILR